MTWSRQAPMDFRTATTITLAVCSLFGVVDIHCLLLRMTL
jgi:hypothetical protein